MTSNSWEVGPLERDAAEESLRKQKANNVKFHSLPFLVRKGNKGLTLTTCDANGRMGHVPIEGSVANGFAVNQSGRRLVGSTLRELMVALGLLPTASTVYESPPTRTNVDSDPPIYDGEAPAIAIANEPKDKQLYAQLANLPTLAAVAEPEPAATYANLASLPPLAAAAVEPSYAELSSLPPLKTNSPAMGNRRAQRVSGPAWLINERDLQFDNKFLGAGASGEVRRARWNGSLVAVKQLSGTHSSKDAYAMQAFQNELTRMHKLPPHPNVTSFFGSVIFESGAVAAVLELCADGALVESLYGASCKKNDWKLSELLEIAHDCACGLHHLHEHLIVHRDLAARNVLLTSGGGRQLFAKLCDLGLSRLLADRDSEQLTVTPEVDSNGAVIRREWLAPEQITSSVYSLSTDMFAFAVLLFEIFARQAPWAHLAQLPNSAIGMRVLRKERLEVPKAAPEAIRALMVAAWDEKPQLRPTIGSVREALAKEIDNLQ